MDDRIMLLKGALILPCIENEYLKKKINKRLLARLNYSPRKNTASNFANGCYK